MNFFTIKGALLSMTALMCFGCSQEEVKPEAQVKSIYTEEEQLVIDKIKEFQLRVNGGTTKSLKNTYIIGIDKQDINSSCPTRGKNKKPISLYNVTLNTDGAVGYSVLSVDERCDKIFAYVEEGDLSDTLYNIGLRDMFRGVRDRCRLEVEDTEEEDRIQAEQRMTRANVHPVRINPLFVMKWGQGNPYNSYFPMIGSSRTVVGCAAVAASQAIAHFGASKGWAYKWWNYKGMVTSSSINPDMVKETSSFMLDVARACGTQLGVSESPAHFGNINNALRRYGLHTYQRNEKMQIDRLYDNLKMGNPVIASGANHSREGHAWLYIGTLAYCYSNGRPFCVDMLYTNWGWYGASDGWYWWDDRNRPSNSGYDFYRDNSQIFSYNFG